MTNVWYVFIVMIGVLGTLTILLMGIKRHSPLEAPCQDSVELRRGSDSEFKCHPKATLNVQHGNGIPSDHILATCQCRQ